MPYIIPRELWATEPYSLSKEYHGCTNKTFVSACIMCYDKQFYLWNCNSLLWVQPRFILLTLNVHPPCHMCPHSPSPFPSPHSLEPQTVQTCKKKNRTKTKHDHIKNIYWGRNRQHACLVSVFSTSLAMPSLNILPSWAVQLPSMHPHGH